MECVSEYIFRFKKTYTRKQIVKQIKEKKKRSQKKRRKLMLLYGTVDMGSLTGCDDIVCKFALFIFNLQDQPTEKEHVLKNNKLWKRFVMNSDNKSAS